MRTRIRRDAGSIISIVTIVTSLFLLITTLMLDDLHRWIMPIEQNELPYLITMISGILIALGLLVRKIKSGSSWNGPSKARMLAPYAILTISCIGIIMILLAGEVDRFLTSSASSLLPVLTIACALGLTMLMISKSTRHNEKEEIMS